MKILTARTRPVAAGLILAVGWAAVAPLALAAPKTTRRPTLAASAAARVASVDTATAVQESPATPAASDSSGGFFKTKKGVAVLVLMAGVITWTAVSRSKDAIHSPARN
jgi:zona occludens toxin (predicted ATPase)